ncbi:MAG: hypothetical protein GY830_01710 [Bacteroidetes bacterium]|nr:hypothetical protein [Bacteroidota bacterium]
MIIKTKKYSFPKKKYITIALRTTLLEQWWVFAISFIFSLSYFYFKSIWIIISILIFLAIYVAFWTLQFYGVTIMEQTKLLFEKVSYELTSKQITIQLSSKQGMPIEWKQVKKAYNRKKYFLLIISRAHLIYLPHSKFNNINSVKLFETILKRKNLIK